VIGRYHVERALGRGAMGVIYQAHDPVIDRKVAIKLIRADLLGSEERAEFLARFRHEAQAAGRCAHPNIVAIYDYAMHEGNPFLAMEYVEGINLGQVLAQSGPFAPPVAVEVIVQVLDALACAHALGIVHRDVKPANILLLPDGRVKMTDFGISRLDTSALTQAGSVIGTPSYMSPEQCRGDPVDARSDLFSAGVVLFELLSGRKPFTGANFTETALQVINQAPPTLPVQVPDWLVLVVEHALAKPPEERFASAAEMAAAIRRAPAPVNDRTVIVPRPQTAPAEPTIGTVSRKLALDGERELAVHLGPIARVLVRRTLAIATSNDDFWQRLAAHIEREADRRAFLSRVRKP
jgi:serine/threonine-protein kinase